MDKWRLQVDSARQIGLKSQPRESSDCSVDGIYGGQSCRGGIPKIEKWENVFNGGATTSSRMDKQRPRLDLAHRIGLRSHLPDLLTVVLMYEQVVKFAGQHSENRKVRECFQWQSDNQLSCG